MAGKIIRITEITQRQSVTILRFLYPLWTVLGLFSLQYVPNRLIVAEDAAKTFQNISANQTLFGMSIAGSLLVQLVHIAVVLLLYQLFKTVNKNQAFLVVILGLVGVPIAMLNEANHAAALLLGGNNGFLAAFEPAQRQSLLMFFLDLYNRGVVIASIFWGLWLIPQALLIYESKFFPKIIGHLMLVAGIAYFLDSFRHFLLPESEKLASILSLLLNGEVVYMLWVVLKGAKFNK